MKFAIIFTALVAGASAGPLHARKTKGAATNAAAAAPAAGAVTKGTSTLVLKETKGVAGNECLTFRNNGKPHRSLTVNSPAWEQELMENDRTGEMVDAACVNTAADRQMTPSTLNGQNVLLVQRTFTAGFRADLVNKQACVGFNGTTFLAQDCAAKTDFVTFKNNQLVAASGACQSGHDGAAQLTVDATGKNCAALTSTTVTASTT